MNKTNLQKGIALNTEINDAKATLETEEYRVALLVLALDEKYNVNVKVRSADDTWVLHSTDILHIYRTKVAAAKDKLKALESEFKKL